VTFTVGTGNSAQKCSGTTNSAGRVSCNICMFNQSASPLPVTVTYGGNGYYSTSTTSVSVTVMSPATTPALACQTQSNPAATATATGGLTQTASASTTCTPPPAQISVTKTPGAATFTQGSQVSFTINVSNPAPRTLARTGSVTCRIRRPMVSAWIWAHTSEFAPPPMKARVSNLRPTNRSTAPSNQRLLSATPS